MWSPSLLSSVRAADNADNRIYVSVASQGECAPRAELTQQHHRREVGERISFRHSLIRSAAIHETTPAARGETHQVLADVTGPVRDPDRPAWHRAMAADGLDEEVAVTLDPTRPDARGTGGSRGLPETSCRVDGCSRPAGRRCAGRVADVVRACTRATVGACQPVIVRAAGAPSSIP
jgi:hypothetical protein